MAVGSILGKGKKYIQHTYKNNTRRKEIKNMKTMLRGSSDSKLIGGHRYYARESSTSKQEAQAKAKRLRSQGHKVRIIAEQDKFVTKGKTVKVYVVWVH